MVKPTNLIEAEQALQAARTRYHVARSNRALRDAREDIDFWSAKVDMLTLMLQKRMIGGAA